MYEAICESGGTGAEASVPLSRGQEAEQFVCRVACVLDNHQCFAGEAGGVNVLQGGEWCSNDLLRCVHNALERLPVLLRAASSPHCDAAGQDALYGSSVKCGHDGRCSTCLLQFAQEVEALLGLLRQ